MADTKPSANRYYRPELDVVRFLAFIFVFVDHTLPHTTDPRISASLKGFAPVIYAVASASGFGLSLFFALSAFLICELLLRERATVGTVKVKQFYIRRILRIWPLYYLAIGIGAIVAFLPGGHPADLEKLGWYLIFMGAWVSAVHGGILNPAAPLWSISVEEQFYAFVPWVAKFFNRKSLYGFCLLLILVSSISLYSLGRTGANFYSIWFNSLVQFECFAAGILLCLILRSRLPSISLWQRLALFALALACWIGASSGLHLEFPVASENPGSWHLIAAYALASFGCVLILIAFLGADAKLFPRWAIYLGRISYGLYVFHEFALYITTQFIFGHVARVGGPVYFLKAFLSLGLDVLMAALSYRYFETPFLKLKKRHAVIESQPVLGAS